jgi:predicted glycosyl hydrolase (DUF1957 family)
VRRVGWNEEGGVEEWVDRGLEEWVERRARSGGWNEYLGGLDGMRTEERRSGWTEDRGAEKWRSGNQSQVVELVEREVELVEQAVDLVERVPEE